MTEKTLLRAAIRIDGGTQARVELDLDTVAEYKAALEAGATFPPVVVFFDGTDNWLADGFHRYFAYADKASIPADVRQGSKRDAILFSVGANGQHGKRPTNADKRKAVGILLADAVWSVWSDSAIAKACGVSHMTVGRVRAESASLEQVQVTTERKFTDKNGNEKVMDTGNIGKGRATGGSSGVEKGTPKPAAAPAPAPAPTEADQIAQDAHGDIDLVESLESAERECKELREQIAVANADDVKAEALKYQHLWAIASRRQQELQQVIADREAELRKHVATLRRIGKAVGEDDPANIAATVELFVRSAKVNA